MEIPSYFIDFLRNIGPSDQELRDCQKRHRELQDLLVKDECKDLLVTTFLQGSYRRSTLIRQGPGSNIDVDVVVVTKMSQQDTTPDQALETFIPFVKEHYSGQHCLQGRSIGIKLETVDLDLVVTSAPSESQLRILQSDAVRGYETLSEAKQMEEWKLEPLQIPDREVQRWVPTHPLEQIRWTHRKNRLTNGYFVRVVRALKEWKRNNSSLPKYPKGYPLEHLIGVCCKDDINSVAEGVTFTLESIVSNYADHAAALISPILPDLGVPEHNVFQRITGKDFAEFYSQASLAAKTARMALESDSLRESVNLWAKLFGGSFPEPPDGNKGGGDSGGNGGPKGGYTPRQTSSTVGGGRFA